MRAGRLVAASQHHVRQHTDGYMHVSDECNGLSGVLQSWLPPVEEDRWERMAGLEWRSSPLLCSILSAAVASLGLRAATTLGARCDLQLPPLSDAYRGRHNMTQQDALSEQMNKGLLSSPAANMRVAVVLIIQQVAGGVGAV